MKGFTSLFLALILSLSACGTGFPAAETAGPAEEPRITAPAGAEDGPSDADGAQEAAADNETRSDGEEHTEMGKITLTFNGHTYAATLADNSSAQAFAELLKSGPLTVSAHDYGDFEKVGDLGTELPRNDEQITTSPGDIILYQGDQITVYYAENAWNFTRLGRVDDPSGLREALGDGDVEITFQLPDDG